MAVICQRVLDVLGISVELALTIVVSIFKGKGDIRNCCCYRAVKLLGHGMKVVKRVLWERLCRIVSVDEMQKFYVFCGPRESFCVGMGNEEERNTRSFG